MLIGKTRPSAGHYHGSLRIDLGISWKIEKQCREMDTSTSTSVTYDMTLGLFSFGSCMNCGDCLVYHDTTLNYPIKDEKTGHLVYDVGAKFEQISLIPEDWMSYYFETATGEQLYRISAESVRKITGRRGFMIV